MTQAAADAPGITRLLRAWRAGDEHALDELVPLVYDELKRLARRHLRREPGGQTQQPTALVHEAYLRLVDAPQIDWRDRVHFFAVASNVMRRVLVDTARAKHAAKRGGHAIRVALDDVDTLASERRPTLIALDDALNALAAENPRKARVVELRVFGGLSLEETAAVLAVSTDTVSRDWKFVTSWLRRELTRGHASDAGPTRWGT